MKKHLALLLLFFSLVSAQETEEVIPRVMTKDGKSYEGEIIELNKKECVIKTEYGTMRIPVNDLYFIDYGIGNEFKNMFKDLSDSILDLASPNITSESDDTGWKIKVSENPIDDSKTYILYIESESGRNSYGKPISLFLRKKSGETEVFIDWGTYVGQSPSITTRFDKEEAIKTKWTVSSDNTATFPFDFDHLALIRKLLEVDTVVFQMTPYSENPITAVFNVQGLKEIIDPYSDELGWEQSDTGEKSEKDSKGTSSLMMKREKFIPYTDIPVPKGGWGRIQRYLVYPKEAKEAGIEGTVVIHAFVSEDGVVTDTEILRSNTPELDQAAMDAVRKVKFKPAKRSGKPAGAWISVPVNFRLK